MEGSTRPSSSGHSFSGSAALTDATADATGDIKAFRRVDGAGGLLIKDGGLQDTLFRLLYTTSAVRYSASWKYAIVALVFPYLVLLGLLLGPQFHWAYEGGWMGVLAWTDITHIERQLGYSIFTAIVYACAGVICALVALVGLQALVHSKQKRPWAAAVHVTVLLRSVMLEVLYLPVLVVLLSPLACNVIHAHTRDVPATNKIFPDKQCYTGSGAILSLVSIIALAAVMLLAIGNSLADFDPNILSTRLLAAPSNQGATAWMVVSSAMVVCMIIWREQGYMVGITTVVLGCKAVWDLWRGHRYYRTHVNAGCVALLSSLMWAGLMVFVMGLVQTPSTGITIAMIVGIPVAFAGGYVWLRYQSKLLKDGFLNGLEEAGESPDGQLAVQGVRPALLEICSRLVRDQDVFGNYVPASQALGESILKNGMAAFPDNVLLVLQYANYLRFVRKDYTAASAQLLRAAKIPSGLSTRYMTFVVDRDNKAIVQSKNLGSDGAMDMTSLAEFQQALKGAENSHVVAMRAASKFWKLLLRKEISFKAISDAVRNIDLFESSTNRVFKNLVSRYPNNVKLLRSFGRFTEEVTCDPHRAMRLYNEADKIEDIQEERKREQLLSSAMANGGIDLSEMVDDTADAVVCINDTGIIQMTNKVLNSVLGYKAGELDGINVSVLMPAPFSARHNGYLRACKATGTGRMLLRTTKVLAVRKDKSILSMQLRVTRIGQSSQGTLFIGIMHPVEEDDGSGPSSRAVAWLGTEGAFIAVNAAFGSTTGFTTSVLQGQTVQSIAAPGHQLEETLAEAVATLQQEAEDDGECGEGGDGGMGMGMEGDGMMQGGGEEGEGHVATLEWRIKHRFGRDAMRVKAKVRLVGIGEGRMVEVDFEVLNSIGGIAVFDLQGKTQYTNYPMLKMLGYGEAANDTRKLTLESMLPKPYSQFHLGMLKASVLSGEQPHPHIPCYHSHPVLLQGRSHQQVSARLQWWPQRIGATMSVVVQAHGVPVPPELAPWGVNGVEGLLESCTCLQMVVTGEGVIAGVGGGLGFSRSALPGDVFGIDASGMRGRLLSDCVDVFQTLVQNGQLYSKAKPKDLLANTLANLAKEFQNETLTSIRGSFICASKTGSVPDYVPIRFAVESLSRSPLNIPELTRQGDVDPGLLKRGAEEGGCCVRVWSANWVNGHVGVGRDGTVRVLDRNCEILLGRKSASVVGTPLSSMIPAAESLLQRIDRKEQRIAIDALHSDGSLLKVSVSGGTAQIGGQTCYELLVQGLLEEPANSIEGLKRLEMLMGGEVASQREELAEAVAAAAAGGGVGKGERKKSVGFASHVKFGEEEKSKEKEKDNKAGTAGKGKVVGKKGTDKAEGGDGKRQPDPTAPTQDDDEPDPDDPSPNTGRVDLSVQIRKAKRHRRLRTLLENSEAWRFANVVGARTPVIVLVTAALHVVLFAVYVSLVLKSRTLVTDTFEAGQTTALSLFVATDADVYGATYNGDPLHSRPVSAWPGVQAEMESSALSLEQVSRNEYVQTKLQGIKSNLRDVLYETPGITIMRYKDTVPAVYYTEQDGLLRLAELWVQKALLVLRKTDAQRTLLASDRSFVFVTRNTAFALVPSLDAMRTSISQATLSNMKSLQTIALIIALVQIVVIVPAFVVGVVMHALPLIGHRRALFQVLLAIPRHLVTRLSATREEAESDAANAAATQEDVFAHASKKHSSLLMWSKPDRTIELDRGTKRKLALVLAPMVLLIGVILGLHMASYVEIRSTTSPLHDLVGTQDLITYLMQVRYWGNQVSTVRWKTEAVYSKEQLSHFTDMAAVQWQSILNGNATLGLTGSVMKDPKQAAIIQGSSCLRLNKADCRPSTDPYYSAVWNGYEVLLSKYLTNAQQWRNEYDGVPNDPVSYLNYESPTQQFVYELGGKEVADGLRILTQLQEQMVNNTMTIVVIVESVLMVTAVGITALYLWLLRPLVRQTRAEVQRVAKLLSQLPTAMNVEGMVTEMLDIHSEDAAMQSGPLITRLWMRFAELVGRCLMGRRFRLLMELEKAHLTQKAASERVKRDKLEKELNGSPGL